MSLPVLALTGFIFPCNSYTFGEFGGKIENEGLFVPLPSTYFAPVSITENIIERFLVSGGGIQGF